MVRHRSAAEESVPKITNLELVHWVSKEHSLGGQARLNGKAVESTYETFQEARKAILELGALVVATDMDRSGLDGDRRRNSFET